MRRQPQHGAADAVIGDEQVAPVADHQCAARRPERQQRERRLHLHLIPRHEKQVGRATHAESGMRRHRLVAQHFPAHLRPQLPR